MKRYSTALEGFSGSSYNATRTKKIYSEESNHLKNSFVKIDTHLPLEYGYSRHTSTTTFPTGIL